MTIFYNCKKRSLAFFIICASIFICSCETLNFANYTETDLVEISIKDIFNKDIIEITGSDYNLLQEIFEESNIRFFMPYNDDNAMQDILKEIAIVESAEKVSAFTIKYSEEFFTKNTGDIKAGEKLFNLSFSVKALLIFCVKNIDPLKEEIEQIIEEKKWDMEYSEDADADLDASDLFFDIIKLENSIAYLNGIKKQLSKNIILINTILDKF